MLISYHGNCPGTGPLGVCRIKTCPHLIWFILRMLLVESWEEPWGNLGSICISISPKLWEQTCYCFNSPGKGLLRVCGLCVCRERQGITHVKGQELTLWGGEQCQKYCLELSRLTSLSLVYVWIHTEFSALSLQRSCCNTESTLHGTLAWKRQQMEQVWYGL